MKKSENSQDNTEQKSNPSDVERRLFAGLMRTKTLPMVPDHTPSDIPDAPVKPSQPSFADGSPLRQELKQELLAKGMSDDDAEEFLRMI